MGRKNLEGMVHFYFGDGKGKTTSAIGLGVRAAMAGYGVCMIQVMKGKNCSEDRIPKHIKNFEVFKYGTKSFVVSPTDNDRILAARALSHAHRAMKSYDVLIIDEIGYALNMGVVGESEVVSLINSKPKELELVLTGGISVPKPVIELCDYASMIICAKHPYKKGVNARKGIEY